MTDQDTEGLYRIEAEAETEEAAEELRSYVEDEMKLTLTAFDPNDEE
jgi:hypothetical protein